MAHIFTIGTALLKARLWVILTATLLYGAIFVPGFLSFRTLAFSFDRATTIGIAAVGMTVVLIAGQIDLSIGSVVALTGIVAIGLQPVLPAWIAFLFAILCGGLLGLVNGVLTVVFKINSMIATLATMLAISSVAFLVTNSLPVSGTDPFFGAAVTGNLVWLFTNRTAIFLVLILLLHVWLTRFPSGRNLFAVGSDIGAARDSGITASRILVGAFIFIGLCAGLSGALFSLQINTGSPVFGTTVLLATITAVVMGGTTLEGGRGSALGTLGGVITVTALTTAFEYASVPVYFQTIVIGTILIVLIVLDRALGRSPRRKASIPQVFAKLTGKPAA
ncbi:ABC transporter permease [Salinibacterium sp. TMP30]|uniref:ABC transporter permease n=1 Tax=Salinibacterium sp. TMP30 TaxID=3138237 RepID=UPI0031390B4C